MNADDQRSEKDRFKHVSYPRSSASIRGQILLLVPLAHNAGSLRRRLKGSYKTVVRLLQRRVQIMPSDLGFHSLRSLHPRL